MILSNPKHEQFAQLVASGMNRTKAAVIVGYAPTSAHVAGSRLYSNMRVRVRINELQDDPLKRQGKAKDQVLIKTVESARVDKTWILAKLVELSVKCLSDDKWSPAAAAKSLELLGKDLGMFQDYVRIEVFNDLMARMGEVVARYVEDQRVIDLIATGWERVVADQPKLQPAIPAVDSSNAPEPVSSEASQ